MPYYGMAISFLPPDKFPVDPASGEFAGGDIRNQIRRVMENLSAVPEASGRCLENVVKSALFLGNIDDFAEFDEAYYEFFRVSHLRDPHSENISQTRLGWRPRSSPW